MAPTVLLGTPSFDGRFVTAYVDGIVSTQRELTRHGIGFHWASVSGSLLNTARAQIAGLFLKHTTMTHLLMVDADIGWKGADVLRLLDHNLDFVAATYPTRSGSFYVDLKVNGAVHADRERGLVRLAQLGLGFVLIKRAVLELMAEAYPERRMQRHQVDHLWNFWPIGNDGSTFVGEDAAFCRLWTGCGGEIWLDPSIRLVHVKPQNVGGSLPANLPEIRAALGR